MKRRSTPNEAAHARGYPRPQLVREQWTSLDGQWDFHIDPHAEVHAEMERLAISTRLPASSNAKTGRPSVSPKRDASPFSETGRLPVFDWDRQIRVPFSPETPMSGVHDTGLYNSVWYRRRFGAPDISPTHRLLLHFGAVDYEATVWVNGQLAVRHEGGYTPFSADVTDLLIGGDEQTLAVCAQDDPADLSKPRGKQDWKRDPHSIWYYRTTGIWQSVWLEVVPAVRIDTLRWTADAVHWEIGLEVHLAGAIREGLQLHVRLHQNGRTLVEDSYSVGAPQVARRIAIPDPGIDDFRNELRWSPESPKIIDAEIELRDKSGNVIDRVTSYTALRHIQLLGNRFVLNGKPYTLRMLLDQGYWQESGLTAPDDDAFRRDIELVKAMGFNGVRKHQKIEDPRFLYWADHLGLLVWEEMPSCYNFTKQTCQRLTSQWTEAILRDISHPSIVAWVPFNESWGVPDLPDSAAQRHFIQGVYHLTKTLDPTRPVIGNDGWEAVATDIVTIHDYDADPNRLARRYATSSTGIEPMLREERPGHRVLTLPGFTYQEQPIMLTEFGGIAFARDWRGTWGYSRADDPQTFAHRYLVLLEAVRSLPLLAGFCYTQFTDTYQEANGLLYMDRKPKIPLEQIAIATRGPQTPQEQQLEATWRGKVMRTLKRHDASRAGEHSVELDR